MTRRTVGVVTGSRADYGIYRPVLQALERSATLRPRLLVCGMHLAPAFGNTVATIEADGFAIAARVPTLLAADTPEAVAKSMALGVAGFAQVYAADPPDLLLLLGDRYEMFAAAVAALPFALPIAHIHGGERTEGAIDEAIRHALTKMSHLHFATTEDYRRRIIQLGEQPERVFAVGAPGLDAILATPRLDRAALEARLGLALEPAPLLVTFHPPTLSHTDSARQAEALMAALAASGRPVVFTAPNADTGGQAVIAAIQAYVRDHAEARLVTDFGSQAYFSMMAQAAAMVGNSSSGIIEAASFGLPVVNIGDRQQGRIRGANVLDAAPEREAILSAITQATAPGFRTALAGLVNPYGDGHAAERIVAVLEATAFGPDLVRKRFHDLPGVGA